MTRLVSRRALIATGSAAVATLVSGCDQISNAPSLRWIFDVEQFLSLHAQRLLLSGQPLVREYTEADISPDFPPNGTERPNGMAYFQHMMSNFAGFRLTVDGMVKRPLSLTLDEIKALPSRTQITLHNCDEGWSAIGQWTGVPLTHLLQTAELMPEARYIVFYCMDEMVRTPDNSGFYYESIDRIEAVDRLTHIARGRGGFWEDRGFQWYAGL